MIEAPEALYLSEQLNQTIKGKRITDVITRHTPHKFTFYYGDSEKYASLLLNKKVDKAHSLGGMIEINITNICLVFTDGANLRYYGPGEKLPNKHQLLIGFEDQSCIIVSIRMYGGILCFPANSFEGKLSDYYNSAKTKPQVMSDDFSKTYFMELINQEISQKKSSKAFLATEQTVPGLGNGVLQDILYNARIHPKTKIKDLSNKQKEVLYDSLKTTMNEMYQLNGRNTETDLSGTPGKYVPYLSKDTAGKECSRCGETIKKENYLGGSIYFCSGCQELEH